MKLIFLLFLLAGLLQPLPYSAALQEPPLFSFGLLADVQYCDCETEGTRHYRQSPQKLREAIAEYNRHDLAFVTHLGDFIDRDYESFDTLLVLQKALKAPMYHVLGNHDYSVAEKLIPKVPAKMGMKARYYDFSVRNWRFIVLDGNEVSLHATKGSSQYAAAEARLQELQQQGSLSAKPYNGGLGEKQLQWLQTRLTAAKRAQQKVIIFSHYPAFPDDPHNLWNAPRLLQLLDEHPQVVAYFNGHNHAGNYAQRKGVHYLNLEGIVETADSSAFSIIQVHPDRLELKGFGREQDRVLRW
jgi:manganese-dependent ADP-ribose/CDP-alcohol diphosphatase